MTLRLLGRASGRGLDSRPRAGRTPGRDQQCFFTWTRPVAKHGVVILIDNARVHGKGAIAVRIVQRAAQVVIEVDDAGPGVAPERRADAFRAFVPSSAGGLGLDLALVSRIAVAHGGGAWIAERPGGGARVGFAVAINPPPTA